MFYETRNINKQPSGMSFKKDLTSVTFFLSRDFSHWTRFFGFNFLHVESWFIWKFSKLL